jgi:cytochrome c biogenesis protein CcmG/thiol:disulfide interchange protein DsbE
MLPRFLLFCLLLISLCSLSIAQPGLDESNLEEEKVIIENTENSIASPVYYRDEKVFDKAPNFFAQANTGKWVSLNAFENQVVVLNFWASYDRYCLKSLAPLQKLQNKYGKKGLQILIVSIDEPDQLKDFLHKNTNYTFPFLFSSKELAKEYNVWGLPTIYILDRKLAIRKVFSGYINKKSLEKEIRKLL